MNMNILKDFDLNVLILSAAFEISTHFMDFILKLQNSTHILYISIGYTLYYLNNSHVHIYISASLNIN